MTLATGTVTSVVYVHVLRYRRGESSPAVLRLHLSGRHDRRWDRNRRLRVDLLLYTL